MSRAALPLLALTVLMTACSFREFWMNSRNARMAGKEAPALADGTWVQPSEPPATEGKWRLLAFFVPD